jgi:hypothetical protein
MTESTVNGCGQPLVQSEGVVVVAVEALSEGFDVAGDEAGEVQAARLVDPHLQADTERGDYRGGEQSGASGVGGDVHPRRRDVAHEAFESGEDVEQAGLERRRGGGQTEPDHFPFRFGDVVLGDLVDHR